MSGMIDDIRDQLRSNPRLQLALWMVVAIFLVNLALGIGERNTRLESEYGRLSAQLSRLQGLSDQRDWDQRVREVTDAQEAWRKTLWTASTRGLAQAIADEAIREALGGTQGSGIQIDIGLPVPVPGIDGIWQLQISVDGILQAGELLEFIKNIEADPKATSITQFKLNDNGRQGFVFSMLAVLLFDLSDDVEKAASS